MIFSHVLEIVLTHLNFKLTGNLRFSFGDSDYEIAAFDVF